MDATPSSPTSTGNIAGHEGAVKPNGTFRGTPYFDCPDDTFGRCLQGKKKYKKWSAYLKNDTFHTNVKQWQSQSYKNARGNFIIRNEKTGEMVFARTL